jgi:hypothetical protein
MRRDVRLTTDAGTFIAGGERHVPKLLIGNISARRPPAPKR